MSASLRSLVASAVCTALALWAFGCGERTETPTPPKAAERAPAPPSAATKAPAPAAAEKPESAPAQSATAAPDVAAGNADYQIYCASCHGATGGGDGPVGKTLDPRPAKHNDGNYMNPLTDDYLFKVIKFGGASVGKSPMMAPLGGTLSDQQIRDVIAFVRTLANPPYHPKGS
jgi:mono/diheme cytochrome c family protein